MAKNRPLRPGEEPSYGQPAQGGNTRKKRRNRNQGGGNPGGGGGGGGGGKGGADDGLTPGTTTQFAVQDPAAWMRNAMGQANFAPNDATAYGRFLNEAIVTPFVSGWNEWVATHPTDVENDFWDYAQSTGMGLPPGYTGGVGPPAQNPAGGPPPLMRPIGGAPGGNAFASGNAPAPALMDFQQFQQMGGGANPQPLQKRLGASPPTRPPLAIGPAPAMDWNQFNAYMQNEIDKYTPQQQGRYDPGKRAGSIRWNTFS